MCRAVRWLSGAAWLVAWLALLCGPSFAQTPPTSLIPTEYATPSTFGQGLEQMIGAEASNLGAAWTPAGLDAAVSAGENALVTVATEAAGPAAAGLPVTWLGVGLLAAAGGVAYCLDTGCQVPLSPVGMWNLLPVSTVSYPSNTSLYALKTGTPLFMGGYSGNYYLSKSAQGASCGISDAMAAPYGTPTCYSATANSDGTVTTCSEAAGIKNFCATAPPDPYGNYTGPDLACSGDVFKIPVGASGPTCAQSLPAPPPGPVDPFTACDQLTQALTASQQAEPVAPNVVQAVANDVITEIQSQEAAGNGGSGWPQFATNNPISSDGVQVLEKAADWFPSIKSMMQPTAAGDLVTIDQAGNAQPSVSTSTSIATTTMVPPTSTQLTTGAECGNLVAGQVPCGVQLDALPPPDVLNGQLVPQLQTSDLTDSLTDVGVATQTATLTDTAVETATPVGTADPNMAPFPPFTLPFNEWPSVIDQIGPQQKLSKSKETCPVVTFWSDVLNEQVTISEQCVVMQDMWPTMQIVLPPTYLLCALFVIMLS